METLSFSHFKKEVEKTGIANPKIRFVNNSIIFIASPDLSDLVDLLITLLFSLLFLVNKILLVISIPCFVLFWHRLFSHFKGCGILQIDLDERIINGRNRFFLINIVRKVFGITTKNKFSSIKEISYSESSLIDKLGYLRFKKRYFLFLETFKDMPIAVSQFKKEKDARAIVAILKELLHNKEKIIA